jgi:hypothetical protein
MLKTAAASIQILNEALGLAKTARERSQGSKDGDLKELILTLYDRILSLKESVMLVTDENNKLRHRVAELEQPSAKPEIRQVGAVLYYFVGDKGPFCQACYDGPGRKLTMLSPPEDWNGGVRRKCVLCKQYFREKPYDDGPAFASSSDPNGWMGR